MFFSLGNRKLFSFEPTRSFGTELAIRTPHWLVYILLLCTLVTAFASILYTTNLWARLDEVEANKPSSYLYPTNYADQAEKLFQTYMDRYETDYASVFSALMTAVVLAAVSILLVGLVVSVLIRQNHMRDGYDPFVITEDTYAFYLLTRPGIMKAIQKNSRLSGVVYMFLSSRQVREAQKKIDDRLAHIDELEQMLVIIDALPGELTAVAEHGSIESERESIFADHDDEVSALEHRLEEARKFQAYN